MHVMTDAYGSLYFSTIFSASHLLTLVHSSAILPLVKTRGLNKDFSKQITYLRSSCYNIFYNLERCDIWKRKSVTSIVANLTWRP